MYNTMYVKGSRTITEYYAILKLLFCIPPFSCRLISLHYYSKYMTACCHVALCKIGMQATSTFTTVPVIGSSTKGDFSH